MSKADIELQKNEACVIEHNISFLYMNEPSTNLAQDDQ